MNKSGSQSTATGCKPFTTYVQADSTCFREIVQRLTGPSDHETVHEGAAMKVEAAKKTTARLLHERRQYTRPPKLDKVKPGSQFHSGTFMLQPPIPSLYSYEWQSLSPPGPSCSATCSSEKSLCAGFSTIESLDQQLNNAEEEKAIKERRFYLHPSPRRKSGFTEPQLLTLFPLTSPIASNKK